MKLEYHDLRTRRSLSSRWTNILVAAFAVVFVASLLIHQVRENNLENPSFEDWVARIGRPEYRLLAQRSTERHYLAVFDAGGSQMAICYRDRQRRFGTSLTVEVTTIDGKDVWFDDLPNRHEELSETIQIRTGIFGGGYTDHYGIMYPIRPDYVGWLRVKYKEGDRTLLEEVVPWLSFYGRTEASRP